MSVIHVSTVFKMQGFLIIYAKNLACIKNNYFVSI